MENTSDTLEIITTELNPQKRFALFVEHGFKQHASQLIWDLVRRHTAMFYYDWRSTGLFCPTASTVYVIITSSSQLDYTPSHQEPDEWYIVFELGWEARFLGWKEEDRLRFVHLLLAQALVRPLNQWSLHQAEGTSRAARQLLHSHDPIALEIAALHLVFHLRQNEFNHTCSFLANIPGFPLPKGISESAHRRMFINWIVARLIRSGWTQDRIRKEFAEWIWLKKDTWPEWLLMVATANVFDDNSVIRMAAVLNWVCRRFDDLLNIRSHREGDRKELAETYRQLFIICQFGVEDRAWISDRLVQQLASGELSSVQWFCSEFTETLSLPKFTDIRDQAIKVANRAGNYGIALGLMYTRGQVDDHDLERLVKVRGLSTRLE